MKKFLAEAGAAGLLLALAVILGLTSSKGGIYPWGRFTMGGLLLAAALLRPCRLHPALLLPLFAALAVWPLSLVPRLGFQENMTLAFVTCAAGSLIPEVRSRYFLIAVVLGAVPLAVSVIFETGINVIMIGAPGFGLSAGGLLGGANVTAVALAMGMISLWYLQGPKAIGVLLAFAFLCTGSRTGWIALLGGAVLPFLEMPSERKKQAITVLALLFIFGIALQLPRFIDRLDPHYITNSQRISMISGVAHAFLEHPIFGHGAWTFPIVGQRYLTWPKWELHPHSFPLRVLFESGLIGAMAWGAFFLVIWRRVKGPLGAILLTIAAGSLTDDLLWIPLFSAVFFLSAAGILGPGEWRLPRFFLAAMGIVAAIGPLVHEHVRNFPLQPISHLIDEATTAGTLPQYRGWQEDPWALRIAGYHHLHSGDTATAMSYFERALVRDPHMIFAPHLLDLGRFDEAREIAPVLTAWYLGDTIAPSPTPLDWHYGIESARSTLTAVAWSDPKDWRYYRARGASALAGGDTEHARALFQTSFFLAQKQYGTDPILCRLAAQVMPENREQLLDLASRRERPSYPYSIFAPLIYRHSVLSSGENSGWWPQ